MPLFNTLYHYAIYVITYGALNVAIRHCFIIITLPSLLLHTLSIHTRHTLHYYTPWHYTHTPAVTTYTGDITLEYHYYAACHATYIVNAITSSIDTYVIYYMFMPCHYYYCHYATCFINTAIPFTPLRRETLHYVYIQAVVSHLSPYHMAYAIASFHATFIGFHIIIIAIVIIFNTPCHITPLSPKSVIFAFCGAITLAFATPTLITPLFIIISEYYCHHCYYYHITIIEREYAVYAFINTLLSHYVYVYMPLRHITTTPYGIICHYYLSLPLRAYDIITLAIHIHCCHCRHYLLLPLAGPLRPHYRRHYLPWARYCLLLRQYWRKPPPRRDGLFIICWSAAVIGFMNSITTILLLFTSRTLLPCHAAMPLLKVMGSYYCLLYIAQPLIRHYIFISIFVTFIILDTYAITLPRYH